MPGAPALGSAGLRDDACQRPRRVGRAVASGIDSLCDQLRLLADLRCRYHKFCARSRRQRHAGLGDCLDGTRPLAHRHAVERHHLHRLGDTVHQILQLQQRVRRGIQHPPEFRDTGRGLDHNRYIARVGHRGVVDRDIQRRSARHGGTRQPLIAQHEQPLRQTGDERVHVLDALDDQRAGRATQHLAVAEAMRVRVIPVESRGLVGWHLHRVVESRGRLDEGVEDFVLVAGGRDVQAVEVQVGHGRTHHATGTVTVRATAGSARCACGISIIGMGAPGAAGRSFSKWMTS